MNLSPNGFASLLGTDKTMKGGETCGNPSSKETSSASLPVPSETIRKQIAQERDLVPVQQVEQTAGPAKEWYAPESNLHIGFITPLSQQFCATCNRLRLTATGHLRTCLAHEDTPSLRDLLRQGASDEELAINIRNIIINKPKNHTYTIKKNQPFEGVMTGIGG